MANLIDSGSGGCVCTRDANGNITPGDKCVIWWGAYDDNVILYDYCDGSVGEALITPEDDEMK